MSGDLINLRQARKARARDAAAQKGDENAAQFGQTKGERLRQITQTEQAKKMLDQHKLDEE